MPLQRVLPRAPSTTTRISEHAQDNAPCCVNMHGVCRCCQHSVSMARPKARNATLGPFWQGASAAVHEPPMHRRPRSRFTTDRLHVDQPPQPPLCPLPPCEPPCKRRLRGVSSERGVAVSMPKSMLTVTSRADVGRCKRKRDTRGSHGAMGCHGCRGTRPTCGQRRLPPGLPNLAQTGPHNQKGGCPNAEGWFSEMAAPRRLVFSAF